MGGQAPSPGDRVVDGEHLADLVEWQLKVAKTGNRAGRLELSSPVAPIAGGRIDLRRTEQVQLVVVPERPDAQPGKPPEPPDRQQVVVHARIVDPRVGRESSALRGIGRSTLWALSRSVFLRQRSADASAGFRRLIDPNSRHTDPQLGIAADMARQGRDCHLGQLVPRGWNQLACALTPR